MVRVGFQLDQLVQHNQFDVVITFLQNQLNVVGCSCLQNCKEKTKKNLKFEFERENLTRKTVYCWHERAYGEMNLLKIN